MLDDDDDDGGGGFKGIDLTKLPNPSADVTKLPKPPPDLPRLASRNFRKLETQKTIPAKPRLKRSHSNVSPEQAQQEIDRLQKRILMLQTEKEFCKSSYQSGLAKYWDIDKQMVEMQDEISDLQDEFNVVSDIDDDEARALLAATTLKSCEDSLVNLQEKQKKSTEDARLESERIEAADSKLKSLRGDETLSISERDASTGSTISEEEVESLKHERFELQSVCDKVKDLLVMSSQSSVSELVEKIDQLVEKVISLEIIVSSQTAQILTMRAETDELHKHLREVEDAKKDSNVDPNSLNQRLTEVEGQLKRILDLQRNVQNEKGVVRNQFVEACDSLNDLSEKLQSPNQQDNFGTKGEETKMVIPNLKIEPSKDFDRAGDADTKEDSSEKGESKSPQEEEADDNSDWQHQLLSGLEGRDKILLYQYTSILRNYRDTRKKLAELEKKSQEQQLETGQQIQELRCEVAIKDEEIKSLRRKLFSAESMKKSSMKKAAAAGSESAEEAVTEESDENELEEPKIWAMELDELTTSSPLDEKFRGDIDTLLEENLDFWLRFSSSYHQIQKFSSRFKELQAEADKVTDDNDGDVGDQTTKKLRELNTELQVWLEHNEVLRRELKCRFSSLCGIQDEITHVTTKASDGEDPRFTAYQAAKFQGEVINMQQENNKVAKELQTGLDHVKGLQTELAKTISKLHETFELSASTKTQQYNQFRTFSTKSRVPLKTFLFAAAKAKKPSIFACMNPAYHHHHKHQPKVQTVEPRQGKEAKTPH